MKQYAVVLLVSLAGCAGGAYTPPTSTTPPPAPPLTPITLTKQQIEAVQVGTRRSLKDPASARFDRVELWRAGKEADGTINVCGYVNARNSYGGYTGDKPFMGLMTNSGTFVIVGMGGTDIETMAIWNVCREKNIAIN